MTTIARPELFMRQIESDFPNVWSSLDKEQPPGSRPGAYVKATSRTKTLPGGTVHQNGSDEMRTELGKMKAAGFDEQTLFVAYSEDALITVASWRATKLIYRFDPTFFGELFHTPLSGTPPAEILNRLPVNCFYLDWSHAALSDDVSKIIRDVGNPSGIYVRFDGQYLVLTPDHSKLAASGHLKIDLFASSLEDAILEDAKNVLAVSLRLIDGHPTTDEVERQKARQVSISRLNEFEAKNKLFYAGVVSALLYLCSDKPDVAQFQATKVKSAAFGKAMRVIPPKAAQSVVVGTRIGNIFRQHQAGFAGAHAHAASASGVAAIPHVRRAHWHTYWTGSREYPVALLKWLSPILVNAKSVEEISTTIHPVAAA